MHGQIGDRQDVDPVLEQGAVLPEEPLEVRHLEARTEPLNRTRCSVRATTDVGSICTSPGLLHDLLDRAAPRRVEQLAHHGELARPAARCRTGSTMVRGSLAEANRFGGPPVLSPESSVRGMRIEEPGSDQALMAAFVGRDERAAATLYDRFSSRVYGLGIVMLGNHQAAQDLVQDTFVKLWRTAARFDPERGRLETWVLLTARSLAIDVLRRRVLRGPRSLGSSARRRSRIRRQAPTTSPRPPTSRPVPAGRCRSSVRNNARPSSSPISAAAPTAEVAALEGIPQGTVKTRIHAALLRLRAEMAPEADHDV